MFLYALFDKCLMCMITSLWFSFFIVSNDCDPGHGCDDLCAKIDGTDTCVCYSGYALVAGTEQCQGNNT